MNQGAERVDIIVDKVNQVLCSPLLPFNKILLLLKRISQTHTTALAQGARGMFQDTPSATEKAGSLVQHNSAIHVKVTSTPRSVAKEFQGEMPARLPEHGQVS